MVGISDVRSRWFGLVSIETVRTQTKRMFERLNVSSQAEAAARLSRTAPFRLVQVEQRDFAAEEA